MTAVAGSLEYFEISRGNLSNFNTIHPNFFMTFTKVTVLSMSESQLTEFPNTAGAHILIELNLRYNQIKSLPVPRMGFPQENNLRFFFFNNNPVDADSLSVLESWTDFLELRSVSLQNCGISVWPDFSLSSKIYYINLAHNNIQELPDTNGMPVLSSMSFEG